MKLTVGSVRRRLGRLILGDNTLQRSAAVVVQDRDELLSRFLHYTRDMDLARRILQTNRFNAAFRPEPLQVPNGQRLLVFAPHQDDEIIGAGGTLLKAVAAGREVQVVYLTDGSSPRLRTNHRERVARTRRREARRVWEAIGGNQPVFWDIPNRAWLPNPQTAERVGNAISEFKPDCVFAPFFLELPPEHRKVAHLLWLAYQQQPFSGIQVWSYQVTVMICPNVAVNITEVERNKNRLMEMWKSQNPTFDYAHQARGLAAANTLYTKGIFEDIKAQYVELFLVLPIEEYVSLVAHYFDGVPHKTLYG